MSQSNNSQNDTPDLEPQLESAIWSVLAQSVDANAIERVKARAKALQTESSPPSAGVTSLPIRVPAPSAVREMHPANAKQLPVPFLSRSLVMKCLSTAAAIAVVVAGSFLLHSSQSAFGEVIKQLREARSFSYTTQIYTEGKTKPIVTRTMVAEDGRQRQEHEGGTISIMDKNSRIRITLINATKTALVSEPVDVDPRLPLRHPLDWMDALKAHGDKPDEKIGRKELDGHTVEGFVVKQEQATYTVWIDTKSKELIQIEWEMPVKGSTITKIVRNDFRFNEKLDDSLFSFEAPEGFKVQNQGKLALPKGAGGEKSIVEALRGFTKRSDGKFPKSISEWGEWAVLFSKGSKDGKLDDDSKEVMGHLGSIMPFLMSLKKDDYQYLGAGKSLDDERCIVFWYRNKESTLRAIYNDLSVKDVQEKDLP